MFFSQLTWMLCKIIHQKWSFGFLKLKFGMLDWDWVRRECSSCKTKNENGILYYAILGEWHRRQFARLLNPRVLLSEVLLEGQWNERKMDRIPKVAITFTLGPCSHIYNNKTVTLINVWDCVDTLDFNICIHIQKIFELHVLQNHCA